MHSVSDNNSAAVRSDDSTAAWWGDIDIQVGQTFHLDVGGFHLAVTRLLHEWQIRVQREPEQSDPGTWRATTDFTLPGRDWTLQRISSEHPDVKLRLLPALADRPVVIRPYHPFLLPPGETATVYVSSLLFVQVQLVSARATFSHDVPIQMASETWMGPNTMDGELCYAEMTSARLVADALPRRAYRAITPLKILNRSREALNLERVSLPIPMLDLFAANDGALWTSSVAYVRGEEAGSAKIDIDQQPPAHLQGAVRVAVARQRPDKGVLVKAIDRLFG